MDLKIKRRDIIILLYLAGIVAAALVYFLYFSPKMEENASAQETLTQLEMQYNSTSALKAKQTDYETKTASDKTAISQMIQEFPADVKSEDEILYARKLETDNGLTVSSVGITDPIMVYSLADGAPGENDGTTAASTTSSASTTTSTDTTESDISAAATGTGETVNGTLGGDAASQAASALQNATGTGASAEDTGILYKTQLNMTFTSTYEGFKSMLNSIPTDTAKQSISNVTASFDTTTGNLMGTIVIDKFYMTGTTQGYVPPSINDVSVGTDNVFGTVTPAADSAAEEAAAESTAESTAS